MATRRSVLSFVALAGGVALAALSSARPSAHIPIGTSVTWNHDVAGILERRCLSCHRDGGPGPMALTSYDIARPWARAIREEVLERRMPPTALRSGGGLYENARGLSLAEVELLVSWADGGAPQGTGDEIKNPAHDLAHLETNLPLTLVPGDAASLQRTLTVTLPSGWIDAWTFDPGTWPAVSAALRLPNRAVMGDWTAGDPPVEYPAGVGLQIAAANALTIDVNLARPLTDEAMAAMPALRVSRARGPLRGVARRTVQDSTGKVQGPGEQLLAFKLGLADPGASAELFVVRSSGEEDFLLAMGPPGLPDTVSYRLRAPVTLKPGDTVQVRSTSAFSLGIESVASAPVRPTRGAR
jgi:hypothetical protein